MNKIDDRLQKYLNYRNGYYIELGANNGFSQSNTLYLERKKNWSGVLIEPSIDLFIKCHYFRDTKKNNIFCNACVGFEHDEKFVEMEYANLMTRSVSLELEINDLEDYVDKSRKHSQITSKQVSFAAKADTLNNILLKSSAPSLIDFLSVDVEGAELNVFKGLDWDIFKFKIILVETRSPDKVINFLEGKGYILEEKISSHDYLFSGSQCDIQISKSNN